MASYYRRNNGTYCVRVSNGLKDGKQELISTTYKPPKDFTEKQIQKGVKEFAELFEASVHNGLYVPGKRVKNVINPFGMTVGAFAEGHYFKSVEGRLSPNTRTFYRSVIEEFIIPSYGKIRLADIRQGINRLSLIIFPLPVSDRIKTMASRFRLQRLSGTLRYFLR